MPIQDDTVKAPREPHLAVVTDKSGAYTAMPPGAMMAIVTDPARFDGILPLILIRVTEKVLTFRCACRQKDCTRVLKYRLHAEGHHPRTSRVTAHIDE